MVEPWLSSILGIKDVRTQKFPRTDFFKTLTACIPEVMKTGSANLNFLRNFSQLSLSNISLFTVLFTAYVGFFRFFSLLSGKGYVFKWM